MKLRFRMYRRGNKGYYVQDNETGQQESLHTKDKTQAARLLNAKNEASILAGSNLQVARAYMVATDPQMPKRTWQEVVDFIIDQKKGPNKKRWQNFSKDKALTKLWKHRVVETRADQLLLMMSDGTVSTNAYLRRLHNFAFDMNWLGWPILPKKLWPKIKYGEERGITRAEHEKIIARETNPERRDYYEVLWHTGGSQTDVASLHGEDIDWTERTIFYRRKKTTQGAMPRFGDKLAAILERLPKSGPLFPYLITVMEKDRATEFKQRCQGLGIEGITLQCYRYAWAERAVTRSATLSPTLATVRRQSHAPSHLEALKALLSLLDPSRLEEPHTIRIKDFERRFPNPDALKLLGQLLSCRVRFVFRGGSSVVSSFAACSANGLLSSRTLSFTFSGYAVRILRTFVSSPERG